MHRSTVNVWAHIVEEEHLFYFHEVNSRKRISTDSYQNTLTRWPCGSCILSPCFLSQPSHSVKPHNLVSISSPLSGHMGPLSFPQCGPSEHTANSINANKYKVYYINTYWFSSPNIISNDMYIDLTYVLWHSVLPICEELEAMVQNYLFSIKKKVFLLEGRNLGGPWLTFVVHEHQAQSWAESWWRSFHFLVIAVPRTRRSHEDEPGLAVGVFKAKLGSVISSVFKE